MKKVTLLMLGAGMMAFVACGPSAEEKAATEKQTADSIAAVESARIQDSMAQAQVLIEEQMAAAAKVTADSLSAIATADSIAKATKTVKKVVKSTPKAPKAPATSVEKKDDATDKKINDRFKK